MSDLKYLGLAVLLVGMFITAFVGGMNSNVADKSRLAKIQPAQMEAGATNFFEDTAKRGLTNSVGAFDDLIKSNSASQLGGIIFDDPQYPAKFYANQLPSGKWASSLIVFDSNFRGTKLYQDPVSRKLYYAVDGTIYEYVESSQPAPSPPGGGSFAHSFQEQQTFITPPVSVSQPVAISSSRFDPDSLANPYGAGSPYKPDGLMNPYSEYGSRFSSKSWRNPYATDAPKLYDSQGNYKGKLSSNPYDPDSTSNPYGRYGSQFSGDSINNPYGLGSPYRTQPIYVVPSP